MEKLKPFPLTDEDQRNQIPFNFGGEPMLCTVCGNEIQPNRIKAMNYGTTDTATCIECATKNDVPRIRRFDDHTAEYTVETYFFHNPLIEGAIQRFLSFRNCSGGAAAEPSTYTLDDVPAHCMNLIPTGVFEARPTGA